MPYKEINEAYVDLAGVLKNAIEVYSRNGMTRELHPASFVIEDFRNYFLNVPGRVVNFPMVLAELVWIMTGDDSSWVVKYNKQLESYIDYDRDKSRFMFNAAYGKRMLRTFGINQLADVVKMLKEDPGSRQAVIIYRNPEDDSSYKQVQDRACNIASMFLIRDGKLNITQTVRSQDFVWGLPYNFAQFGYIAQVIAEKLEIEVGKFIELANSFHAYEQHWDILDEIKPSKLSTPSIPPIGEVDYDEVREIMEHLEIMYESRIAALEYTSVIQRLPEDFSPFWLDALRVIKSYWLMRAGKYEDSLDTLIGCKYYVFIAMTFRYFYHYHTKFRKAYDDSNLAVFNELKEMVANEIA